MRRRSRHRESREAALQFPCGRRRRAPCSSPADGHDEPMTAAPRLEFRLLGRFAVLRDGIEIPTGEFGGRKDPTPLRIFTTPRGSFVGNEALNEQLWAPR